MTMKNLTRTEFDEVYDILNKLNENMPFKNFLSTFTGFVNGEHIKDTNDVLLNYVNIDKSIETSPELVNIDVKD